MRELTTKESAVFDLIRRSIEKGVIPSVREIGAELGIKSTSSVHRYLTSLEEKGYIERGDGLNRSIRLPGSQVSHIPVLGVVTAGQPILAVESVEEYIPVQLRGNSKELFALRVRGESMIKAGILDGDLIIARRTPTAENGEIVVALIDDEATVKRFYKENGGFRLQPENDTMEPIYTDHLMILGRVVGLQREY
ncbi:MULTISPECIES: transcriptional repressor LexA [unclassified Anaerotruncus]|uniref:transcriptional repressor LexA n=1 Tax=unclassified Anaerotruncus TaxID=2641626 RepID=UPI00033EF2EC|nr:MULTISPECIES: transcriptional repressor LexA [unclassified Anaerotruncus]MCI9161455.1 transcriptional repressor LexA [Anaerotruncus sp.]NCE76124.1 transcriptional repressor LexA [Anaerotruncus sp. X29]RKJ78685.1 transcriptional repressor LexA [Anaerotruncus sp. 1XD22-93]EOS55374.1 repressor LexA [Anaerotruncus sp. G3(2012)]MCI9236568.1 transcriptional repressor LexA [Anaerotruncus sp.]